MQIKITMRYYYISIKMGKILKTTIWSIGEDMEQMELSQIVGKNPKWYIHFGKQFSSFL